MADGGLDSSVLNFFGNDDNADNNDELNENGMNDNTNIDPDDGSDNDEFNNNIDINDEDFDMLNDNENDDDNINVNGDDTIGNGTNMDSNNNSASDNDVDDATNNQAMISTIIQKYERQMAQYQEDSLRIEQEMGDQIQELNDTIYNLENEIQRKDKKIVRLEQNSKSAQIESEQLSALRAEYNDLERNHNDLLAKHKELRGENYPARIREFEKQVSKQTQQIANLEKDVSRLTRDNENINNKLLETIEIKNKNEGILEAYKIENKELKLKNEDYNKLMAENKDLLNSYNMLSAYAKQQSTIISQLSKLAPNIAHLTETYDSIKFDASEFHSHLAKLSNASEILENSNIAENLRKEAEIEDEMETMRDKLDERENEIKRLESEMSTLMRNEELLENYKTLESQFNDLNKDLYLMRTAVNEMRKEINDRDSLIKKIVNDKYETVSVLSKQLDFLRNLIKQHNLSVNLTQDVSTTANGFGNEYDSNEEDSAHTSILDKLGLTALTSWMGTIGNGDTTTGDGDEMQY